MTGPVPAAVTLHVWGVPLRHVPGAMVAMARERGPLRRTEGLTFSRLLGTGSGETFGVGDADLRHWAVLGCWSSPDAARAFDRSPTAQRFDRRAGERLRVELEPLSSKGSWGGRQPFGDPPPNPSYDGMVAALTRARIRPQQWRAFWGSVPPVASDLAAREGLLLRLGVGEAPVGLQGTFSVWRSTEDLATFAYRGAAHAEVIRRTRERDWYAEELFARLAVRSVQGTFAGRPLGGAA